MNKKFLPQKLRKWKRSLLTNLEKRRRRTVRNYQKFSVFYDSSHKGFKEKVAMKDTGNGVETASEFI